MGRNCSGTQSASNAQSEWTAHQRTAKPVLQMMSRRPCGSSSCAKPASPEAHPRRQVSSASISMLRGTLESLSVLAGRGNLVGCGVADIATLPSLCWLASRWCRNTGAGRFFSSSSSFAGT